MLALGGALSNACTVMQWGALLSVDTHDPLWLLPRNASPVLNSLQPPSNASTPTASSASTASTASTAQSVQTVYLNMKPVLHVFLASLRQLLGFVDHVYHYCKLIDQHLECTNSTNRLFNKIPLCKYCVRYVYSFFTPFARSFLYYAVV